MESKRNVKREAELAALADKAVEDVKREQEAYNDEFSPVAMKPLPDGFMNPEPGRIGHLCVDRQGRYRPDWHCLKIHKQNENTPDRQYFNHNGKPYLVSVGVWVDVPPEIISILEYTEQEIISMNFDDSLLLTGRGAVRVVDKVPRFNTNSIKSA